MTLKIHTLTQSFSFFLRLIYRRTLSDIKNPDKLVLDVHVPETLLKENMFTLASLQLPNQLLLEILLREFQFIKIYSVNKTLAIPSVSI